MRSNRIFCSRFFTPTSARAAFFLSALALTGCPSTTYTPATELPLLNPTRLAESNDWPTVRTTTGETEQIRGAINEIFVTHQRVRDPVGTQFDASIVGNELRIVDKYGPRTYALKDKLYVTINYSDRKTALIVGGVALFAGGLPFAIDGIVNMVYGFKHYDAGGFFGSGTFLLLAGFGVVEFAFGGGMMAGGVVLAKHTPHKRKPKEASSSPTLHVGPTGAGLSFTF
jgi:hypothetical protein